MNSGKDTLTFDPVRRTSGDLLPWEKLIEKVTGEPLNPAYFANYLLGEADNGS